LADAQAELANLKAQNADLADQYLRAQADAPTTKLPRPANLRSRVLPTACCRCSTAWKPVWPFRM
jgi:hypothetical protein